MVSSSDSGRLHGEKLMIRDLVVHSGFCRCVLGLVGMEFAEIS